MRFRLALSVAFAAAVLLLAPRSARADGDQKHALRFTDSRRGLGLTSAGAGFAGRRLPGPDVQVDDAKIELTGIPSGAVVETTYLYWVTYGTDGQNTLTINGTAVTGALIGTSGSTCWGSYPDGVNRVYRADVTTLVKANGTYTLTGLPVTAPNTLDGQGASLVVIYSNAASSDRGTVILMDGAITISNLNSGLGGTFAGVDGDGITSATFRVGVGDGQSVHTDAPPDFNNKSLPPVDAGTQGYAGTAGPYWDDLAFDVLAQIPKGKSNPKWTQDYLTDCVVFAYSALVLTNPIGPPVGGVDGGNNDGGTGGPGPADGGGGLDGGGTGSDGGGADGAAAASSDGCGCRVYAPASAAPGALIALAVLGIAARARRRHAKSARPRSS